MNTNSLPTTETRKLGRGAPGTQSPGGLCFFAVDDIYTEGFSGLGPLFFVPGCTAPFLEGQLRKGLREVFPSISTTAGKFPGSREFNRPTSPETLTFAPRVKPGFFVPVREGAPL